MPAQRKQSDRSRGTSTPRTRGARTDTGEEPTGEYRVLARRLRPQTFDEVIGQDHVTRTLRHAIERNRVAHAFLFAGPRGVGKTTTARLLAKALNCEQGPRPEPCNACSNCREIADSTAIDVLELDGASNRGIDDAREIVENVRYRAAKSRFKLYIIDEVHQLTKEAFNALLKTLEEPPPHVKFIFATTEPDKVLPTIVSRCQRYDFRRLAAAEIRDHLQQVVESEGIAISPEGLFLLAREADGSIRDGQSLLEQVMAFAGRQVSDQDLRDILGIADRAVLYEMADAIVDRQPARCLELADQLYRYGYDVRRLCRDLLEHIRNVMVAKLFDDAQLLAEVPPGEVERIRAQAARRSGDDVQRLFRILLQADEDVGRSLHPKLVLEMAVVRLAMLEPLVPIGEITAKLEALEARLGDSAPTAGTPSPPSGRSTGSGPTASRSARGAGPVRRPGSRSAPEAAVPAGEVLPEAPDGPDGTEAAADAPAAEPDVVGDAAVTEAWKSFLGLVQSERKALYMTLAAGRCLDLGSGTVTIGVESEVYARELAKKENREAIEAFIERAFGQPLAVRVQAVRPRGQGPGHAAGAARQAQEDLKRESLGHPTVKAALDILGGEVRAVRPWRRPTS